MLFQEVHTGTYTHTHTRTHTLTYICAHICTQDELKALIQGITFADASCSLKRCTLEINSKYKELNRPAPAASAVKSVWEKLGMNKPSDSASTHKFYTIGVNPDVKSVPS